MLRSDRIKIAKTRLFNILKTHGIACARTLENKISDGGPYNQRIDPHILTEAREELISKGFIKHKGSPHWYYLTETSEAFVKDRHKDLVACKNLQTIAVKKRIGQAREISVYKSFLSQTVLEYFGAFTDLNEHDDSTLYKKEEPPSAISGLIIPDKRKLDFIIRHKSCGYAGIEIKNSREWLYPDRDEIRHMLQKCLLLDITPILIGRRIHFRTFQLFNPCGVIIHETFNQLYAKADEEIALLAANKKLLGFHDIRIGNEPNQSLLKFVHTNLPKVIGDARKKFDRFKDLLYDFAFGQIDYKEFSARVRRRLQGTNEDHDWENEDYIDSR